MGMLSCTKYVEVHLDEVSEAGIVRKSFVGAHFVNESRSRQVYVYSFWKHKYVWETKYYTVPVFYPDEYRLTFDSNSVSKELEGTCPPFGWSDWQNQEKCICVFVPVYKQPVRDDGVPEGEREFYRNQFVRAEKFKAEVAK